MHFVILKNEIQQSHHHWEEACKAFSLDYSILDLTSDNWLEEVKRSITEEVHYLACPPGVSSLFKEMYDERIYVVSEILKQRIYPSFESVLIHENKRLLSYWLKANSIPHPSTHVFYNLTEASEFIEKSSYPIVAKTNIGASGNGVKFLKNRRECHRYLKHAFSRRGIRQKIGPNLKMGDFPKRFINFVQNREYRETRMSVYRAIYNDPQKDFVIFQEFIEHEYEWRIVRIGNAYFGHQKVKIGDKASGTKGIDYISPPGELLDFVKGICEKHDFFTMAVDLFDNPNGSGYLVNELQCIFGHVQEYICAKNGRQGKFEKMNNEWHFIEGLYNKNLSYDERLKQYISKYSESREI